MTRRAVAIARSPPPSSSSSTLSTLTHPRSSTSSVSDSDSAEASMSITPQAPLLARSKLQHDDKGVKRAKQAVYTGAGCDPSSVSIPIAQDQLLVIEKGGAVHGNAATVGEAHISYLCRAWEVNACDLSNQTKQQQPGHQSTASTDLDVHIRPVRDTFEAPFSRFGLGDASILAMVNLGLCIGSFYLLTELFHLPILSAVPASLFISHLSSWLVVLCTSGLVLYRSYSVVDGLNTIARFTLKLHRPDAPTTFLQSNMASSISSTVSTRGSTLNKLMIGVGFSLGLGLFIKFMSLPVRTWLTDITAFAYVLIILTSYYENRTFDLQDCLDHAGEPFNIHDQLLDNAELKDEYVQPLREEVQKPKPSYSHFHIFGVGCFIGVPCLCYLIDFNEHPLSFFLSLGGLLFGFAFFTLDGILHQEEQNQYLNRQASKSTNLARGVTCIAIELTCLTLASAAGICYEQKAA